MTRDVQARIHGVQGGLRCLPLHALPCLQVPDLSHLDFENFPSGTLSMSPTLRTKPRLLLRRIRLDLVNLSNWLEILMYHHLFTQFLDGPAEDGEMFMRPGKLSDYFPRWVLIWKLCEL